MSALDTGRLGIASCATGLASAALELATSYAASRRQFGKPVAEFQRTGFTLADMATAIEAGRALYRSAARRRDRGQDVTKLAAMAKLFCTDTAMTVTTSAVQILGAVGYTTRYPAKRYMREAKVLQIFEGTARRSHICGQDAESVEALGQRGDRTEMPLVKGQDL